MKRIIICLFMCMPLLAFSQDRKEKKAAAEALKIQFITEELDLTEEESTKFWPVFYMFDKEYKKIRKNIKVLKKSFESGVFTESEIRTQLSDIKSEELKMAELREKFMLDCLPILGAEKTQKMVTLEEKLKRKIGDRIKEQMDKNRP